jgi:hypothetical protein
MWRCRSREATGSNTADMASPGPAKNKSVTAVSGWVGQRPKKDQGQIFPRYLFVMFLICPHREKIEKESGKNRFGIFVDFFVKTF